MRRLRPTDGTQPHRRAAQFHLRKCKAAKLPLHTTLQTEMKEKVAKLVAKSRAVEDAEDELVGAMAESEAAEEAFEDLIRNVDGDLARLDREDPSRNARGTVFPEGFGAVIDPDGDKQLDVIPGLKARLSQLGAEPIAVAALAKVTEADTALRTAFDAEDKLVDDVESLFAEENEARREVREQLDSAYGRLRDFYKARPALAERFFLKEGRARKTAAKKAPPAGGGAPGGSPA